MSSRPVYQYQPIGSVAKLAELLGYSEKTLNYYADNAESSYHDFCVHNKKNGKSRNISEPKLELKKIQKRINSRIFSGIIFPLYLQGGIKTNNDQSRDYITNANFHCNPKSLINIDISSCYPNIKLESIKSIYRNFFKFPTEVIQILSKLTSYKGSLPQGGCTSSYLANLVLFNHEHQLVKKLNSRGMSYTRLIDDITISCFDKKLEQYECESIIKDVSTMLKKNRLSIKNSKTKINHDYCDFSDLKVTGLNVKHKTPKVPRKERRYIRLLVHICEQESMLDTSTEAYHKLWHETSGKIAKLSRLGYSSAKELRKRLSTILPTLNDYDRSILIKRATQLLTINKSQTTHYGTIKRINEINFQLNILYRTDPMIAIQLRKKIALHFGVVQTKQQYWD